MSRVLRLAVGAMVLAAGAFARAEPGDLKASLAQIPGIADTPEQGVFVDLVKAIGGAYPGGRITIALYPWGRSIQNAISGSADFHIPSFVRPGTSDAGFPYSWVPEPLGSFTLVIYSRRDRPLGRKDLLDALARGGRFPYVVEVGGGTERMFPFPTVASNDQVASLRKVQARRIDAVIYGVEADQHVKALRLDAVHRAVYGRFDDVIVVPKTPRGEEVKRVLAVALRRLKASGRLQQIYRRAHSRFTDWQPADMGW